MINENRRRLTFTPFLPPLFDFEGGVGELFVLAAFALRVAEPLGSGADRFAVQS
jgi:hypothetical protein